jgi:hypothetical protein
LKNSKKSGGTDHELLDIDGKIEEARAFLTGDPKKINKFQK